MIEHHRSPHRAPVRRVAGTALGLCVGLAACAPDDAVAPTAPPLETVTAAAPDGGGEVWVAAQDRSEIHILHGFGGVEVVSLPAGTGPHELNFSPSGAYVYAANVDDGTMRVIRASDRTQAAAFELGDPSTGDVGTHQAAPSPDGTVVLVAQIPSRTLFKVSADEAAEDWQVVDALVLEHGPICSAFSADGSRAYVSLAGPRHGIAVVDVASMSLVSDAGVDGIIDTDGNVQCGLVPSRDGRHIFVDSWGDGMAVGHFYMLDTWTNELTEVTSFAASDLHGFAMSPNERYAFAAERGGDALRRIDRRDPGATPESIALDPRPGLPDRPDKVATRGNTVFVPMRAEGSVAVVNGNTGKVRWIRLVPASTNALHGVVVRP